MKVEINGVEHELGMPNELSAQLLEVVQKYDTAPTPLGTLIAVELFKIGIHRIIKDVGLSRDVKPEDIDERMDFLWKQATRMANELYEGIRD
jgi:hypothetical protein